MDRDDPKTFDPHDPLVHELVRRKISRVVARSGLSGPDSEDFAQDLWQLVWPRLEDFDPSQGPLGAFVLLVARRCAIDLFRSQGARQRHQRGTPGLVPRDPERSIPEERADLNLDITVFLDALPAEKRELARRLMTADSLAEAARDLGRPRSTLQHWVKHLREVGENLGLRDYL